MPKSRYQTRLEKDTSERVDEYRDRLDLTTAEAVRRLIVAGLEEVDEEDDDLVLFRCAECGYVSLSLGQTHAHIEQHRGYTRFNIQLPFTSTAMANADELMDRTEVVRVTGTEDISLDQVDEFGEVDE